MQHTIYEVSAFTAHGQNGNPAGVVLEADGLSAAQMQDLAAQAKFPETAFVNHSQTATCKLRFFTPTTEVDLCGHATIAAWSLMHQQGLIAIGRYTQATLAGILGIEIMKNGMVFMQQTKARFSEKIPIIALAPLLGITRDKFHTTLSPQIVSTGLRDLLIPLKSQVMLAQLQPNLEKIAQFSRAHHISGLHIFGLTPNNQSIASARNFAPADGIDEEAATGTSNGALLCYLEKYGLLPNSNIHRIEQGEAMNRPSYIYGKFINDAIWIGGATRLVSSHYVR